MRKVEPLARALAGAAAWVTGLRGDQIAHRSQTSVLSNGTRSAACSRSNPLFDWTRDDVVTFAKANHVPVNALHEKGFVSIGCAPCTRAIKPGEPERAGRWWWESEDKKECGLHVSPEGRASRVKGSCGMNAPLTHLQKLEAKRSTSFARSRRTCEKPVLLYSIGKDSAVLLHLAMKAFYPAKPPFPLLHVDTTWKFQEMIAFRDQRVKRSRTRADRPHQRGRREGGRQSRSTPARACTPT